MELRDERDLDDHEPLVIDLIMVSHVDDDHINGILGLFREMRDRAMAGDPPLFKVKGLWHNSFDEIIGNDTITAEAAQFGAASFGAADRGGRGARGIRRRADPAERRAGARAALARPFQGARYPAQRGVRRPDPDDPRRSHDSRAGRHQADHRRPAPDRACGAAGDSRRVAQGPAGKGQADHRDLDAPVAHRRIRPRISPASSSSPSATAARRCSPATRAATSSSRVWRRSA